MTCEQLRDEYEAFALGIAEEPERAGITEHLALQCPTCTHGVREAAATVVSMSLIGKQTNPPKQLRRRVLGMVGAMPARSRVAIWLPWAVAFTLALILASVILPVHRNSAATGRFAEALAILNDPAAKDVSFGEPEKSACGRVFVSPRRGVVLIAANLPSIPANKTFQLWVMPQWGTPVPAGTFRSEAEGAAVYVHSGAVENVAAIAVTVEPAGGSAQPTSTPFIVSKL